MTPQLFTLVLDTTSQTPEDECKWFFYCQMIYSPETNNTMKTWFLLWLLVWKLMHNDTYSVRKHGLVLWRARLLTSEAFCNVYPPPLSDTNCPPYPPPGGPGPPTPPASKMAPISPGSTHTPSTLSVTTLACSGSTTLSVNSQIKWKLCQETIAVC